MPSPALAIIAPEVGASRRPQPTLVRSKPLTGLVALNQRSDVPLPSVESFDTRTGAPSLHKRPSLLETRKLQAVVKWSVAAIALGSLYMGYCLLAFGGQ